MGQPAREVSPTEASESEALRQEVERLSAEADQLRRQRDQLQAQLDEQSPRDAPLDQYNLEHAPLGIVQWDRQLRVQRWSKRSEELFGWAAEEVVGRSWNDFPFVHAEDAPRVAEITEALVEGQVKFNTCVNRNYHKDGSVIHCVWFNSVLRDPQGAFRAVFSLVYDITSQVHAEQELVKAHQALAESHLRQQLAMDAGAIGTWDYEVQHDRVRVDPQMSHVFGISGDRFVRGASLPEFLSLIHRDDRREIAELIAESLNRGGSFAIECRLRGNAREPGPQSARWIVARGTVQHDEAGQPVHVLGAVVDITDRKRAQFELEQTRAFLLAAIEASPAGIIIADAPDVRIRMVNSAAVGMRGLTSEELTDIPVDLHPSRWQCFRADGKPFAAEELPLSRAVLEGVVSRNVEIQIERSDGKRQWVLCNAAPVRDPDGRIMGGVVVFPDVTEQRKAADALRQTEAELAHVVRLSTMGEMVGGIAHELNQPLFAVQNFSKACITHLEDGGTLDRDRLAHWLEQTTDAAEHAGAVLVRLRDFVTKRPSQRRRVPIEQIVNDAMALTQFEASRRDAVITPQLPEGLPDLVVDPVQIQQVLVNLIRNGLEAIDEHSGRREVTIRVRDLAQARDLSTSDLSTSDLSTRDLSTRDGNEDAPDASASVQVSVIDSGRGLPAGGSQELFQAFHSTKPQGMGLGLAIAQTIIESHGGKLWATEAAGGGAAFHFTLKRAA